MKFHDYFCVSEYTGSAFQVLHKGHPLHEAVQVAGSIHQPTILLADVQRPPGHTMRIDVPLWTPGLTQAGTMVPANGMFAVDLRTPPQVPTMVKISAASPHMHMTTAHEMGHVMDHFLKVKLIGAGHVTAEPELYASERLHVQLQPWWRAVQATRVYQGLHATQLNRIRFGSSPQGLAEDSPAECFACSFAQLVATNSGHSTFIEQLRRLQSAKSPRYWSDVDFKPVGQALQAMFSVIGW